MLSPHICARGRANPEALLQGPADANDRRLVAAAIGPDVRHAQLIVCKDEIAEGRPYFTPEFQKSHRLDRVAARRQGGISEASYRGRATARADSDRRTEQGASF